MASFIFNFNRPLWMKNKRVAWAFLDAKDERTLIHIWHILRLIASHACLVTKRCNISSVIEETGDLAQPLTNGGNSAVLLHFVCELFIQIQYQ